ncbi:MAG TPA: glycoside hydrolase family 2 TIM barrel-domain containing protein [Saprospiraceae bacterium]|nr:glycoside hydrolase family 2 TIM barrel-domain containing protein [Saprospiraceae bacterium]
MKIIGRYTLTILICCVGFLSVWGQSQVVKVDKSSDGFRLMVDNRPMMLNGMNWDYVPIGTDVVDADFWNKPDNIIQAALDAEMALLQNMGVNVIRVYTGIQPKWITYIYDNYGIYTMLNHTFGRYGLTLDGVWTPITEYDDAKTMEYLMSEVQTMVNEYKNTRGLLLYLLGNENNYGLFWQGAETEDFPEGEDKIKLIGEKRGRPMYKLMNDAAKAMKSMDASHPVAICNGDVLFLDIIAEECKDVDIYGTNAYRGVSFGDMFQVVKDVFNKPIMFTEFGSDAYNAIKNQEDQEMQAYYLVNNWREIYENAAGLGLANNSIGGFTFQFSDGWWKAGFDDRKDADSQQTESTWNAGGYTIDEAFPGANNMNEEWFGICAKGPTNELGLYKLYPRAAYYALQEAHNLNLYENGTSLESVQSYFGRINLTDAMLRARGDKAALAAQGTQKLSISNLQANFDMFTTGGSLLTTPETADPDSDVYPNQTGFDHMQSYFVGIEARPASNIRANVNFNVVGKVAENPINEIFYENVARPVKVETDDGEVILTDNNRLRVYNAEVEWNAKHFDLKYFYRTGHYHWGYEGDFFGLYPEANYGPNLDIYNGEINGAEIQGKGKLGGFTAALGPQLWWGANPTMLFKYTTDIAHWKVTGIYHRDFDTEVNIDPATGVRELNPNQVRSGVIPPWATERATIAVEKEITDDIELSLGGIWGGNPLNGIAYQDLNDDGEVVVDRIKSSDNWGGKMKLTYAGGRFNWYGQASAMGLVANGGVDQTTTFTGWRLKDSGSGNMTNVLSGFTYSLGNFQFAPNFLWQRPLVDPIPNDVAAPGKLRNWISDPFAVRGGNRETMGFEMLISFDPTPGTWMYEWNNDRAEDAKFAMDLSFVYRKHYTAQDAGIGFLADRTIFAFDQSAPQEDLWEVNSRIVSKLTSQTGIIANLFYGNGQANGDSDRLITRYGGDLRMIHKSMKVQTHVRINDWGPFDYHRDFNLTYPVQLMLDVSTNLGNPDWFVLPGTSLGIQGTWRSLDEFSPRYAPLQADEFEDPPLSPVGFPNGSEWEIRTYLHVNIGQ